MCFKRFKRESVDGQTDGCYQTYYLPCFAVDKYRFDLNQILLGGFEIGFHPLGKGCTNSGYWILILSMLEKCSLMNRPSCLEQPQDLIFPGHQGRKVLIPICQYWYRPIPNRQSSYQTKCGPETGQSLPPICS